jgi:type I restriction enzyme, S subunit
MVYQTKKMGEVCEVSSGNSAPQKEEFFKDGIYPFFRTSDVGAVHISDYLCDARDLLNEKGIGGISLFKKGTVLFPKSGASTFLNHRVVMGCDGYVSSHLATIKAKENLDDRFLFYFLLTIDAKDITANSSYPSLRLSDISNLEIPLPHLKIQKEIVAKLDEKFAKLKEVKKMREFALVDTEKILSQTLHEIFDDGKKNGWKEKSFNDESILKMTSGGTPSRGNKSFYIGNIPWLKSGELQDNTNIINSEEKITKEAVQKSSAKLFPVGTVLFAMYGATAGKIGILGIESSTNQAVAGLIPVVEKLNNKFLYYFLMKKREEILRKAWGGAQPNLSQTILKRFSIPLPSINEQKKIVAKLDKLSEKLRTLRELQKTQLEDLKKLEKAYLREAFNGELV